MACPDALMLLIAGFEKGSIFYQREISERIPVRPHVDSYHAQSPVQGRAHSLWSICSRASVLKGVVRA